MDEKPPKKLIWNQINSLTHKAVRNIAMTNHKHCGVDELCCRSLQRRLFCAAITSKFRRENAKSKEDLVDSENNDKNAGFWCSCSHKNSCVHILWSDNSNCLVIQKTKKGFFTKAALHIKCTVCWRFQTAAQKKTRELLFNILIKTFHFPCAVWTETFNILVSLRPSYSGIRHLISATDGSRAQRFLQASWVAKRTRAWLLVSSAVYCALEHGTSEKTNCPLVQQFLLETFSIKWWTTHLVEPPEADLLCSQNLVCKVLFSGCTFHCGSLWKRQCSALFLEW